MANWQYVTALPLAHGGDCSLIGVSGDLTVYAEGVYGDEGWVAQCSRQLDGTILSAMDEDYRKNTAVEALPLPDDLARPKTGWHTMELNFSGARHRGIRREERISDVAQPLSIEDR